MGRDSGQRRDDGSPTAVAQALGAAECRLHTALAQELDAEPTSMDPCGS